MATPRWAPRHLVRWTDNLNKKLLLCMQFAVHEEKGKLPWQKIGALMAEDNDGVPVSEGAIVQHLAKMRTVLLDADLKVPPNLKRGGGPNRDQVAAISNPSGKGRNKCAFTEESDEEYQENSSSKNKDKKQKTKVNGSEVIDTNNNDNDSVSVSRHVQGHAYVAQKSSEESSKSVSSFSSAAGSPQQTPNTLNLGNTQQLPQLKNTATHPRLRKLAAAPVNNGRVMIDLNGMDMANINAAARPPKRQPVKRILRHRSQEHLNTYLTGNMPGAGPQATFPGNIESGFMENDILIPSLDTNPTRGTQHLAYPTVGFFDPAGNPDAGYFNPAVLNFNPFPPGSVQHAEFLGHYDDFTTASPLSSQAVEDISQSNDHIGFNDRVITFTDVSSIPGISQSNNHIGFNDRAIASKGTDAMWYDGYKGESEWSKYF